MKPQQSNRLILFDLVSTLTDAGPRYARAFQDVCAKKGLPVPEREEILSMLGNSNLSDITERFIGPMAPADKKDFMSSCNEHCDALLHQPDVQEKLLPGVKAGLQRLKESRAVLGIYTATRENALADQMDHHGLRHFFDPSYIRGKDNQRDVGQSNKAIKAAQIAGMHASFMLAQGVDAQVIVVGDSEADVQAATDLGLPFVGFALDDRREVRLKKAGAVHIIRDLQALPAVIESLFKPPAAKPFQPKL